MGELQEPLNGWRCSGNVDSASVFHGEFASLHDAGEPRTVDEVDAREVKADVDGGRGDRVLNQEWYRVAGCDVEIASDHEDKPFAAACTA